MLNVEHSLQLNIFHIEYVIHIILVIYCRKNIYKNINVFAYAYKFTDIVGTVAVRDYVNYVLV